MGEGGRARLSLDAGEENWLWRWIVVGGVVGGGGFYLKEVQEGGVFLGFTG